MNGLTIVCVARLQDQQLERHLIPLHDLERVERIVLIRHAPLRRALAKVEHVGFPDRGPARNSLAMFRLLRRVLTEQRVDWLVAFNPLPWGLIAQAAAARTAIPVVISLLGTDYHRLLHPLGRILIHVVRRADVVTVPGPNMAAALAARGVSAGTLRVLPHAIDTERFAPSEHPPSYDVMFVGQLIPVKQVEILIEAVRLMTRRARIAIVGDGTERVALTERAKIAGVADRVEFLGYRQDVEAVLRQSRILVLCSQSEGLPFAMIEAMASGLAPVVPDVGEIGEVISSGMNGVIFRPTTPRTLADTLDDLLADEQNLNKMRMAARATAATRFSLQMGRAFWTRLLEGPRPS